MEKYVEKWKNGNQLVVRSPQGKVIARKKYNPTTYKKDLSTFKQNHSFLENKKVNTLVKMRENSYTIKETKGNKQISKYNVRVRGTYQYQITAILKNGEIVNARSEQHEASYSKQDARDEAYNNLQYLIAEKISSVYDDNEGARLIENGIIVATTERIITYTVI